MPKRQRPVSDRAKEISRLLRQSFPMDDPDGFHPYFRSEDSQMPDLDPLAAHAADQVDFARRHQPPDRGGPADGITLLPETVIEAERDSERNVTRLILAPAAGPRRGDAA